MNKNLFSVCSKKYFEKAVESLGGVQLLNDASFPAEINNRLAIVDVVAMKNALAVDQEILAHSLSLANAAKSAKTGKAKVTWLRKAGDAFNQSFFKTAACQAGCSHCCHIPLTISHMEASVIAQATGRTLPKKPKQTVIEASYQNPCPFLLQDRCSIYADRPISCRIHLNMDNDELLCKLTPGTSIPVPYADKRFIAYMTANVLHKAESADIRDWFPTSA